MNCPRGCDTTLNPETQDGLEVDRCGMCDGIWLDLGEGEIVTRPPLELPPKVTQRLAELDLTREAEDASEPLTCPRCYKLMARERYSKSGVHIDRCACGVWLDGGELEKIRAYRQKSMKDLLAQHGSEAAAKLYEKAFSQVFFDLGTPPEHA